MRLRYLSLGLVCASLLMARTPAAVIYKWTDADGVVHFSDQPQAGAERIVTKAPNTTHMQSSVARGSAAAKPTGTRALVGDYTAFEIDSPQPEQAFSDPTITVRLHLEPALKAGHAISLYLNGKLLENQPENSVIFTLTDLARGTYSLMATLSDQITGDTRSTVPVTFYVHQTGLMSPLSPLRKKTS